MSSGGGGGGAVSDDAKAAIDDAEKAVEQWKVKKLIATLEAARGNGTSMISLIVPPKDQISRVSKMLNDEIGTATHIKSRVNRQSVLGAITSTMQRLKLYNRVPTNGLVIYCGSVVTAEGKEKKINIDFEPFKPINTSLYLCDNKFHTEALNELLESDDKFGFIIMDGNGALFGTLSGNCFPECHEVLTADGFRSLAEMQAALARDGKVAIACPRDDGSIELRDITSEQLLVHEGEHQHVHIRGTDEELNADVELLPTTNHRMFVRMTADADPASGDFSIVQAGELPLLGDDEGEPLVELMANCPGGLHRPEQELPFMAPLNLRTRDQFDAFLQLYGYWLARGRLETQPSCVAFASSASEERLLLNNIMARLGLALLPSPATEQDGFCVSLEDDAQTGEVSAVYRICSPRWVRLFGSEESRAESTSPDPIHCGDADEEIDTPLSASPLSIASRTRSHSGVDSSTSGCSNAGDGEELDHDAASIAGQHPHPHKRLWGWVLSRCSPRELRLVLQGLRAPSSQQPRGEETFIIRTPSALFRDEVCRAALQAGYSVRSLATLHKEGAEGWEVSVSSHRRFAQPRLNRRTEMRLVTVKGVVWCVSVPTPEERIIVRRVLSRYADLSPKETSRPVQVGNTRTVLHKFSVDLPKKHGRGGQSALRFARLRLEKRHNYLRKVAETAVQMFIANDRPNVAGLILAGSAEFKQRLNQSDLFDIRLQAIVTKIVDVSYGGENGFNQAIELAADSLLNVKFIREKKLLSTYFGEIAKDSQKYCFGVKDTLAALESGAVEELIVWESLDIARLVLKNKDTGIEKVVYMTEKQEKEPNAFREDASELEVVDRLSLLEWLANNFKSFGAKLQFVTNKSQEGSQFVRGFGGIGGLLRYQLDFLAMEAVDEEEDDFI